MTLPGTFARAMEHAFGSSYEEVMRFSGQERLDYIELLGQAGYPLAGTEAKREQMVATKQGATMMLRAVNLLPRR